MINGPDWLSYFERVLHACGNEAVVQAALQCQSRYPQEAGEIARNLPYPWNSDQGCYEYGPHLDFVMQVTGDY